MANQTYKHWKLETDDNQILWLGFDRQDKTVNAFSLDALSELGKIADGIDKNLTGVVIYSLKSTGFIAGADINVIRDLSGPDDARHFIELGQTVFDKVEKLPMTTVALINGFCMGGGTELILSCDHRIVYDDPSITIGLPEVKLGFHPGWGGTVRLPRLVGPMHAMDMMLTGRGIRAGAAKRMGLVDAIVPERQAKRSAIYFIKTKPARKGPGVVAYLARFKPLRSLFADYLRKQTSKKARKAHYPSPYAMIDLFERTNINSHKAYKAEADSILSLLDHSETVKNLVRVFDLQEKLKQFGKDGDFKAQHVHVIGAGIMGGDIAAWCALQGCTVTLQDREVKFIAPAIKRAYKLFKKKLKKDRPVQAAMDRLIPDVTGKGIERADVIIEAIFENLEAKQAVFKDVEKRAKKSAILATNTSSLEIDKINTVMRSPKRLVGIHFFNPVAMMPLVEVIEGEKTDKKVFQNALAFVGQIKKLPIPVKSSPGFLVNRILMPYLMECMTMVDEGISAPTIDRAAKEFGMPMGPVELADLVGLDVAISVVKEFANVYGGQVSKTVTQLVDAGHFGKKTGQGFYKYDKKGKAIKSKDSSSKKERKEISERLIMRIINEANACVAEKIVADADLVDAGIIFGTGFAPFTGGPLHYANSLGNDKLTSIRQHLIDVYGERFSPEQKAA